MQRIVFLKYIFLLLAVFISAEAGAQQITVLSVADKTPVAFATFVIRGIADGKEKTLVSDDKGMLDLSAHMSSKNNEGGFHFPLCVTITSIGYEKIIDTIYTPENKTYLLVAKAVLLNETVVTAQYAPGSTEKSVFKIDVIDRKKMDAMAAVTLRDVLTNETGIQLTQDNILGAGMSMNGVGGEHVKIMIDGVPIIGRQNGNIDLSEINLNDVERIEIIHGPLSVNYGTNALAGTINIITRKTQEKKTEFVLNSYCENIGTFNFSEVLGFQLAKSRVSLSGGRNYFNGWNVTDKFIPDFSTPVADSTRYKSWKPREQYFGRVQYNYRTKTILLGYKGEMFSEKIMNRGYPRAPYMETAFDDYYYTKRNDNAVYAEGSIAKNKHFNFVASLNNYRRIKNSYFKDLTTLAEQLTSQSGDQDTSVFAQYMCRAGFSKVSDTATVNYEAGYDINYETATGKRIQYGTRSIADYAAFASAEINATKKMVLRPGLRYGYNNSYGSLFIPSLNVKMKIHRVDLRMSYARGFRAPSIKELDFYFVDINHNIKGNRLLKAEYSHNANANVVYKKAYRKLILQSEWNIFYNDISNLITLAQISGNEYSYVNIGAFKSNGIEWNESFYYSTFKATVGAGYTGTSTKASANSAEGKFNYYPEVKFNVIYEPKNTGCVLALFYKYQGEIPVFTQDAAGNIEPAFVQSYHMADVTATKSFFKKRILLSLGIKNLFDVKNINGGYSGGAHATGDASIPVATGQLVFTKLAFNFSR